MSVTSKALSAMKRIAGFAFWLPIPAKAWKTLNRWKYEQRARELKMASSGEFLAPFLNYGYAPIDESEPQLTLLPKDEPFRLSMQLYYHVAGQVDLAGREVLEVGSGRGGGCSFIRQYLNAKRVVGLDLSPANIAISSKNSTDSAISFKVGDAECFPFPSDSFDAVVNVESSHCYPNIGRFFLEVHRVLREGGYFLYADLFCKDIHIAQSNRERMLRGLKESPFHILRSNDITDNVIASLDARSDGLREAIQRYAKNETQYAYWVEWSRLKGTNTSSL